MTITGGDGSYVRDRLPALPGYRFARDVYHRLRKPELLEERRQARTFYRGLVSEGELAFDVGAFRGEVSEALADCGARVVAVEPNPGLARRLRRLRISSAVEETALGSQPGKARLLLGVYPGHSTVSEAWASVVRPDRFSGAIEVDVVTLDQLVSRYGPPAYVKIDVEGYESEVLAGLSHPVRVISFEFQCEAVNLAEMALGRLAELGRYEYNLTVLEERRFVTEQWCDEQSILHSIEQLKKENHTLYGDVFARLK